MFTASIGLVVSAATTWAAAADRRSPRQAAARRRVHESVRARGSFIAAKDIPASVPLASGFRGRPCPADWIPGDVGPHPIEPCVTSNDTLVVVALPHGCARYATISVDSFRRRRLERTNDTGQGIRGRMTKARAGRGRAGTTVSYMQDAVNVIRHADELVEHE